MGPLLNVPKLAKTINKTKHSKKTCNYFKGILVFLHHYYKYNKTPTSTLKALAHKFLDNTISDEELALLKQWLENSKNRDSLKELLMLNSRLDYAYRSIDAEKAYQQIITATSLKPATGSADKTSIRFRTFYKYAAAIALVIGSALAYYFMGDNKVVTLPPATLNQVTLQLEDGSFTVLEENKSTIVTNKKGENVVRQDGDKLVYTDSEKHPKKLEYNTLSVPYGKRFQVEMADGTLAILNSGTTLRYPKDFTDPKSRDVFLKGEALFTVKKDEHHPFFVHTDDMNIRVLGTQFNVSSYENENFTSAVLVEGSVEVYANKKHQNNIQNIAISPGQMATTMNGKFNVTEVDVKKHIAWIDGTLFFINDPFRNIIKEMERHYDTKIINTNMELNDVRYTGTFQSETLLQILEIFQKNTEFDYEVKNDSIIIASPTDQE